MIIINVYDYLDMIVLYLNNCDIYIFIFLIFIIKNGNHKIIDNQEQTVFIIYRKFSQELEPLLLSKSSIHLIIAYSCGSEIYPGVLPDTLTHLTFHCDYRFEIKKMCCRIR